MSFPPIINKVIKYFSKFPGIGKKTALRMTFFLLNSNEKAVISFANALIELKRNIKLCSKCFNFSENTLCEICKNSKKNDKIICVVETVTDLYAIESTGNYNGLYHVLHGAISPIEGVNPSDLKIKELIARLKNENIKELIIATNPTSEGNATAMYILKMIEKYLPNPQFKISRIASGVPVGSEVEYIDKLTLEQAIKNRVKVK